MSRYSDEFQTKEQALDDARVSAAITQQRNGELSQLRTALAAATKRAEEAEDARIDATESHLRSNMLLEDAEEKLDAAEQENARLREAVEKWVASYRDTLRERMAADRRRDDHGAYAANETVLADLDTLAALLAETGAKGGDDGK